MQTQGSELQLLHRSSIDGRQTPLKVEIHTQGSELQLLHRSSIEGRQTPLNEEMQMHGFIRQRGLRVP